MSILINLQSTKKDFITHISFWSSSLRDLKKCLPPSFIFKLFSFCFCVLFFDLCLLALLDCLFACLFVCLFHWLFACLLACLFACLFACCFVFYESLFRDSLRNSLQINMAVEEVEKELRTKKNEEKQGTSDWFYWTKCLKTIQAHTHTRTTE